MMEHIDRLLIVGMGRSGMAAALAARRLLPQAVVILSDSKTGVLDAADEADLEKSGVMLEPGRSDEALLEGCGLVIKSPGVPGDSLLIEEARLRGIPVWGEVEFARRFLPNVFVGITGTNGKTTTCELTGHLLREAGYPCRVAGNVGTALSSLAGAASEDEVLVVELSSFQLEDSITLRPDIAVLLNLTEDHMDRHPDMVQYLSSKMRIFTNQQKGDIAVINMDDPNLRGPIPGDGARVWFSRMAGSENEPGPDKPQVFARDGAIYADLAWLDAAAADLRRRLSHAGPAGGREGGGRAAGDSAGASGRNETAGGEVTTQASKSGLVRVVDWSRAALKGEHNLENSLAATAAALALGLSPGQVAAGLKSFPGVKHRLQEVRVIDGVRYINDSKATNVDAALKALTAFEGGIHLILGGSRKGCSFDSLAAAAPEKVREVILIGDAADEIAASFSEHGRDTVVAGRLEDAVNMARANAVPGDVVLMAPACASFDQYKNFEERGEHFISLVNRL